MKVFRGNVDGQDLHGGDAANRASNYHHRCLVEEESVKVGETGCDSVGEIDAAGFHNLGIRGSYIGEGNSSGFRRPINIQDRRCHRKGKGQVDCITGNFPVHHRPLFQVHIEDKDVERLHLRCVNPAREVNFRPNFNCRVKGEGTWRRGEDSGGTDVQFFGGRKLGRESEDSVDI